jgi:hypothetical protein
MKYLMFETRIGGIDVHIPVIFPNALVHSIVAKDFHRVLARHYDGAPIALVSGGSCNVAVASTYGISETAKVSAKEEDAIEITNIDYTGGIQFCEPSTLE